MYVKVYISHREIPNTQLTVMLLCASPVDEDALEDSC